MPFTPDHIQARMRDLRRIAAPIVEHYRSDLDRDEEILNERAHAHTFVWLPYQSGTHLAPLLPSALDYLEAVIKNFASHGEPYLVTRERVTRSSWDAVRERMRALDQSRYQIIDVLDQRVASEYHDRDEARGACLRRERPSVVREINDKHEFPDLQHWLSQHPQRERRWSEALARANHTSSAA